MATRKGLKARVTFIGPLLELDGKELGEFRNNRFEPSQTQAASGGRRVG
jgi:hypothetical protein